MSSHDAAEQAHEAAIAAAVPQTEAARQIASNQFFKSQVASMPDDLPQDDVEEAIKHLNSSLGKIKQNIKRGVKG